MIEPTWEIGDPPAPALVHPRGRTSKYAEVRACLAQLPIGRTVYVSDNAWESMSFTKRNSRARNCIIGRELRRYRWQILSLIDGRIAITRMPDKPTDGK